MRSKAITGSEHFLSKKTTKKLRDVSILKPWDFLTSLLLLFAIRAYFHLLLTKVVLRFGSHHAGTLHYSFSISFLRSCPPNRVIHKRSPKVHKSAGQFSGGQQFTLSQFCSGYSSKLESYLHKIGVASSPSTARSHRWLFLGPPLALGHIHIFED